MLKNEKLRVQIRDDTNNKHHIKNGMVTKCDVHDVHR